MSGKRIFKLATLSAALAAAWGPVFAQEDPAVAEARKPESFVSLGAGYWSDDRPRLGTYDGMREKGAYGLLDALIVNRDDATGTWFRFDARNLGLDTRSLRADWERQGNFGLFLEYDRLVRDEPYTVLTGVTGIGTPTIRVPTPSATALGAVQLGTVRESIGGGFSKIIGGGYDFRLTAKSEDKQGARLWGRGGAPEFAAEPIDSNIRQMEAVLSYTQKKLQLQGGYYGSWYQNRNSIVDTANMNPAGTLSNPYFLTLPLDNQAHQLYVNGGYNFTDHTRGNFKVAYTRATQNEQIPIGFGVPVFSGAPSQLDGRIDNTLVQAGVNSRATSNVSWLANLRYYNSDEKTAQYRIVQPAGGCATGTCVDTTPLTFKTLTGKLEGTYRFTPGLSAIAGAEYSNQDRNVPFGGPTNASGADSQRFVPFRAELKETTLYIQGRRSLSETLNGSIRYAHSKRDGSDLTQGNEAQENMINPINIADRDRDKFRLMLDWSPLSALTLTFNAEYAKDKYGNSDTRPYGLRDGEATLFSLDGTYAFSENWQMNAWYSRDNTKANQFAQRNANGGAAEAVKEANLEDTGDTFGLGLRGAVSSKLKLGADVMYQKNVNKYPETLTLTGAGTLYPSSGGVLAVGPLPDITNKMTRLKLNATYALQKNSELRFEYIYEQWKTDDWTWFFADRTPFTYGAGTGTTTDGTQVVQDPKQQSNWFGVRYIYRFQ